MQDRGMERLPVLIKDNKQSNKELSFSFSLRQKPFTSIVSLFEMASEVKSKNL